LWRDVWTTNDTKRSERRERVSRFSWPFACFVIRSTDAQIAALVYKEDIFDASQLSGETTIIL